MKIYSSITVDMNRPLDGGKFAVISATYEDFVGSIELCKGDNTAKQAEQQQQQFNSQLMTVFQKQYAQQSSVLSFLQNKLEPMVTNPTGYSPDALAAMRTGATDSISGAYQNAQRALQNNLNQRNGGSDLPAGSDAQLQAALFDSEAKDKSSAQNTITLNNENLKQSNLWNSMKLLSGGVASQFNPLGYANSATSGSNAVAGLSEANTQANSSGFLGNLESSLGKSLGTTLGGGNGSSLASMASMCWIAAEIFDGWNDPRTSLVRKWLRLEYSKTIKGKFLLALYIIVGRPLAWVVRKSTRVRRLFETIFHEALKRAQTWEASLNSSKEII